VYGYYTAITVTRSTFKNNSAGYGGAIGAITIRATGSNFLSNRAVNQGGALSAQDMTLSGTRFISNTSGAPGGGLRVVNHLDAVNTLFAGNQAGWGAAVLQLEGSQYTLRHVTIAHPSLGSGPAILLTSGTANLTNTIIASYTVGISQTGGILNTDYNLFFTATPTQTTGGTLNWGLSNRQANPRFVNPAAGNYRLKVSSPAIDAAMVIGVMTDLDGVARPVGDGYDIGAYEFHFGIFLPLVQK
jgi:predicted outer membrane repeat protein